MDVVERDARGLEGERRRRLTVVGVAGNVDDSTISGRPTPRLYAPYAQAPTEVVTFVILAETPANTLGDAARAGVWRVDADQVVARTATLDQLVSSRFDEPRFVAVVMGVFAAIGMIIAGLGLYGTLSYTVVARFRELGIRIAVGARRGHVVRLIARQGGLTYVVGLGAGIAGAWALVRVVMSSVVVRVSPRDPATFLLAALVLAAVAALAIAIPVRRATKIDRSSRSAWTRTRTMATGLRWLSSRVARLFPWLGRRRAEREIRRELDRHLELEMQEQRKLGMSRSDAARAARVNLGNVSLIREDARAVWGWHWADVLSQDARRALRSLFREPELNAVVMLALAIGLTTATFTVADGLLFRPVPFDGADRLARVSMRGNTGGRNHGLAGRVSGMAREPGVRKRRVGDDRDRAHRHRHRPGCRGEVLHGPGDTVWRGRCCS